MKSNIETCIRIIATSLLLSIGIDAELAILPMIVPTIPPSPKDDQKSDSKNEG